MMEFLNKSISEPWGIVLVCVLVAMVWIALSILLYRLFFKRFYDILLSGMALIVLSPMLLLLIALGAIKMKGNPFFTQLRPGKREKIFKLIKFRTMTCEKDENGELLPDEYRLTRYGKFLRSTSLDELPELLNIFAGHMSIVGPRPQLVRDMVFMTDEQRRRHSVCPGLTGLAQVMGRNNISWEKKFEWDLKYIDEGISFFKDIKVIFLTVWKVFRREDTVREGTASDIDFGDYLLESGMVEKEEYDIKQAQAKELLRVE